MPKSKKSAPKNLPSIRTTDRRSADICFSQNKDGTWNTTKNRFAALQENLSEAQKRKVIQQARKSALGMGPLGIHEEPSLAPKEVMSLEALVIGWVKTFEPSQLQKLLESGIFDVPQMQNFLTIMKKAEEVVAAAPGTSLRSVEEVLRHGITFFPPEIWSELYESTDLQMRMAAGSFGRHVCDVLGERKTPSDSIHNIAAFLGQLAQHLSDYGDEVQRLEDVDIGALTKDQLRAMASRY